MARRSIEPWDFAEPAEEPAPCDRAPAPMPEILPADPTAWDGRVSPHGRRDDGSVIRRGPARKRARSVVRPSDRRVKLGAEARREIRRRARGGETAAELAPEYGVDPTTIRDLLRGRTHAGDNAQPVPAPPNETPIGLRESELSPGPLPLPGAGWPRPSRPAGPGVCEEIRRLHREEGWSIKGLSGRTGLDRKRIRKIIEGDDGTRGPAPGKLTPGQRAEARELSRQGWGCRRLAKRFGVARKTMWNLLRGEYYRDDPGAPPPRPKPHRWDVDPKDPMSRDA